MVEYAGGSGDLGDLVMNGASPTVTNSVIRRSVQHGVWMDGASNPVLSGNTITENPGAGLYVADGSPSPVASGNVITGNGGYALSVHPQTTNNLGLNTASGNLADVVEVRGDYLGQNTTWPVTGLPYVVTGDVIVRHPTAVGSPTTALTIRPGVEVRFAAGTELKIGDQGGDGSHYGALDARGTADSAIVFTSAAMVKAPGDWKGIRFTASTNGGATLLERCVVEYAGGSGNAGDLVMNGASPTVTNSVIRRSVQHGVWMDGASNPVLSGNTITENPGAGLYVADGSPSPVASGNVITGNGGYALSVHPQTTNNLGLNTASGNLADVVEVRGDYLGQNTTWPVTGLPYVVTGDVIVRHPTAVGSPTTALTVRPGVEVRFAAGTELKIGDHGGDGDHYGALDARGTVDSAIVFTSAAAVKAPGDWKGIRFAHPTNSTLSMLDYCVIEYAGQTLSANLYVDQAAPAQLQHLTLTHGSGYGAVGSGAPFALHDCDIQSNALGGVNNLTPASVINATSNWWGSPSGPSGSGPGTGQSVSAGVLFDPWRTQPFRDDLAPPVVVITRGPAEGAILDTAVVEFRWAGMDDVTPVDNLEYAYRLDAGTFSSWSSDTATVLSVTEGQHRFEVKTRDLSGQVSALATRGFAYDAAPPNTQIASGPADSAWINTGNATFQWTGADAAWPADSLEFSFQMDSAGWSAYARSTSHSFTGLASGPHAFAVQARDLAGHVDPTPAQRVFTVDVTLPTVAYVAGPAEGETLGVAGTTWTVRGADDLAALSQLTYSRSLDGGAYGTAGADSVVTLSGLSDGAHTLAVRAHDLAGNASAAATRHFRVEASVPVLAIVSGPAAGAQVDTAAVTFVWRATSTSTTSDSIDFRAALDAAPAGAWSRDTSATFAGLAASNHTLNLEARDRWGHVGSLARTFRVDAQAPTTTIATGPAAGGWSNAEPVTFTFTGTDDAAAVNELRYTWRADSAAWSAPALSTSAALAGLAEGVHSFEVAAVDRAGNVDATPASRTFTVDRTAPTVAIVSGPAEGETLGVSVATLVARGSDDRASAAQLAYSRSLDGAAYTTPVADSTITLTNLGDGAHTLAVRAHDAAGNAGVPVTRTWRVEATAAAVVLLAGPAEGAHVRATAASFDWTASSSNTPLGEILYRHALDGSPSGAWTRDTTASYSGLAPAAHTFTVESQDRWGHVNALTRTWRVDTLPPNTTLASGPADGGWANSANVTFTFSGSDDAAAVNQLRYTWRADSAAWSAVGPGAPVGLSGLAEGAHTFEVAAVDRADNQDPSPALSRYTVDLTLPQTELLSGPAEGETLRVAQATFTFTGSDDRTGTGALQYAWRLDGGGWSAYASAPSATPTNVADGPHTFEVRARDLAGNADATPAARGFWADTHGPVVALTAGPAAGACLNASDVAVAWSATDVVTPRASLLFGYRLDGAGWSGYAPDTAATFPGQSEGQHTLEVRALDLAGNVGTLARTFTLDRTAPVMDLPTLRALDGSQIRATCTASDNGTLSGFHVQIATDSAFASPVLDATIGSAGVATVAGSPGHTYFARGYAIDCAGNASGYSAVSNEATLDNLADLAVRGVTVPATASSGLPMQVSWTVADSGLGATNVPRWYDDLYLSPTATFNPGTASYLGRFENPTYLAAGEAYSKTAQVTLPRGAAGTYHVFAFTDNTNLVSETDNGNNGRVSGPVAVTLSDYADLVVTGIAASPTAYSGETINVRWTVKNQGSGRSDSDHWYDTVFLSADSVFGYVLPASPAGTIRVDEQPLGQFQHVGALEAESTYVANVQVRLPDGIQGAYHVFVASDLYATAASQNVSLIGSVFENTTEINPSGPSPTQVTMTPPPNLVAKAASVPVSAASGTTVAVNWRVANQGFNATRTGSWTDRVYFSTDTVLDGGDRLMGSFGHGGDLALDAEYTQQASIALPIDFSGTHYVFVRTDADGAVYESDESDNVWRAPWPLTVTLSAWPDLRVTGGGVVVAARAGEVVPVSWTVQNHGVGTSVGRGWSDIVYLSPSPTWGAGPLRSLGAFGNPTGLAPGASYTRNASVALPTDLSGTQYAFVVTDGYGAVFENGSESDNVRGLGAPGDTGAIGVPVAITVTAYPPVDLIVTGVTAPDSAASGRSVSVTWTVSNTGSGTTLAGGWTENVYLSADTLIDGSDLRLASVGHGGALGAGEGYAAQASGTLPNGFSGTFHALVRTDAYGNVADANTANNTRRAPGTIAVRLTPAPDLAATSISTDAQGTAGQPLTVRWTVANQGPGPIVPERWTAGCYLSSDAVLDGSDVLLSSLGHSGPFLSATTVSDTVSVTLPSWASGPFYLFVRADNDNSVYEAGAEGNNTARTQLQVTLSAPANLVVRDVVMPSVAIPGEPVTVSWTLANIGSNPAVGQIHSAVYVSPDPVFDVSDPVLDIVPTTINLPPGTTQHFSREVSMERAFRADALGNLTAVLPGVSPGGYHGIVRVNVRNSVREETLADNAGASADTVHVEVAVLAIGDSALATLQAGQSRYYRIEAPAGQDLSVQLETESSDATNELFAAFGRPPSPGSFDFAGPAEFTAHPSILVPSTQAGPYYVLLTARALPFGATSELVKLRARALPFSITAVTPARGGQAAYVTTRIDGAGLRDSTRLYLVANRVRVAQAERVKFENTTALLARWDLSAVLTNSYDVEAEVGDSVFTLKGAFTVERATTLEVVTTAVKPDVIRRSGTNSFTFRFRNASNRDLPVFRGRLLIPATSTLVNIATDDGLRRRSDLFPERFTPIEGDVVAMTDTSTGSAVRVLDLVATEMAPERELSCTVVLKGFEQSPFSIRALTETMELSAYLQRELTRIEAARRSVLSDPAAHPVPIVGLASDAGAWADTALQRGYVERGLVSAADVTAYAAAHGGLVGDAGDEPAGPADLLAERSVGGSCGAPAGVPECRPDEVPLTTSLPACRSCFEDSAEIVVAVPGPEAVAIAQATCGGFSGTLSADARVIAPCDPNLLTGPAGFGASHWVGDGVPLVYRVDFENLPVIATAPAQVVQVRVPIDANLELSSLRLGNLGFGANVIDVPANQTTYSDESYFADLGLNVRITAGVDVAQRAVVWTFTSIDPETGAQPTNSLLGFLPVNDVSGRGMGFVNFSIRLRKSLATGVAVTHQASIKFDVNSPLLTNTVSNLVDATPPHSAMMPTVELIDSTRARVRWSGTDDPSGTGLRDVAVYLTCDGSPYSLQATGVRGDSLLVPVESGRRYALYTIATDNAGNVEPAKSNAEAWVGVPVTGVPPTVEALPTRFALYPAYPNPFQREATVRFDLPVASEVTLEWFDVAGRRVAVPLHAKRFVAGRHSVPFRGEGLASGLYFYRFQAGRFEQTRKMLIIR